MVTKLIIKNKYFFKYIIIDNFLSPRDFEFFSNKFSIDELPFNKRKIILDIKFSNINDIETRVGEDCIAKEKIIEIIKNYSPILYKILSEVCPSKSHLADYINFTLVLTGKNYKYPIHDDTPNKLLSVVVYLKPTVNSGTILYPCPQYQLSNGEIAFPNEGFQVKWKQNRAMIFSRIPQKTWHSYQGDGKQNRLALVMNIGTNREEDVIKVEKCNEFKKSITWSS